MAINVMRIILSVVFIFSGFVKAIDPIGGQYKIHDYLDALGLASAVPDIITLMASVGLAALEFTMGMFLLFAIYRRLVSQMMLLFMTVMTAVTVWIYAANPVSDCGCFGDAVVLTNGETLMKNVILLLFAVCVAWKPLKMARFVSLSNQWIVVRYTVFFILGMSVFCLYDLPVFDFRPYHIGANIPEGMQIPDGEEQPQFETTFILEKDGVRKEFTLDDYPDSTWTFVDSKSVQTSKGYVPPIHDFSIVNNEEEDITDSLLAHKGYTFLLISPHLSNASDSNFGNIDLIYEYAKEHDYPFYCLTASGEKEIEHWRDLTGAEYEFATTDEITLKTIVRSNPGLLLIKDGTIIGKWSHNSLPAHELTAAPLEKSTLGELHEDGSLNRIVKILLGFVLPLTLLSIADRLWFWTRWLKEKERNTLGINNPIQGSETAENTKNQQNNEKENRSR